MKRFDVLTIGDEEKLNKKRQSEDGPILYFVTNEELYEKIGEIHAAQRHGGINKMMMHVTKKRFANITEDAVKMYISFCAECQKQSQSVSTSSLCG